MSTPTDTSRIGALGLVRRFLADRGDPEFARELAARAVESLPIRAGDRVLDVGAGPGHYTIAMHALGATVAAVELSAAELRRDGRPPAGALVGDGRRVPFADATFDAVLCSNMLEHTPDPLAVLDEIARVLRPGGWAYVSWTNWLSPFGGHAIAPFHYLGAERGERVYRRVLGPPKGKNLPYDGVWPLAIGTVLEHLDGRPALEITSLEPRYYPGLRAVMRIPGVREVVAWNCVIRLRRRGDHPTAAAERS
jgi:SAM-dependent methyltransferase